MTKSEDVIKSLIKEYNDQKLKELNDNIQKYFCSIFLYGFICGALFSYTSLFPVTIGIIIGGVIVKKDIPIVNYIIDKTINYMLSIYKKYD